MMRWLEETMLMEKACNGSPMIITFKNQTDVTSPNFPQEYNNNSDCSWSIISDSRKRIKLSIQGDGEIEKK